MEQFDRAARDFPRSCEFVGTMLMAIATLALVGTVVLILSMIA